MFDHDPEESPLDKAIRLAGGQSNLSRRITALGKKCSQQNIWWWKNKAQGKVPAEFVPFASAAVDGEVSKEAFRPDLVVEPMDPARPLCGKQRAAA